MSFDISTLVTDRGVGTYYNASDLNRVGAAVQYVAERFTAQGYAVTVSPKTDWLASDIPTASELETYRQNIATLRGLIAVMKSTPETPETMRFLDYIKANDPKYVLILSGDHLYRMDYRKMLKTHIENNADLTVSVMPVPWEEASRFGILTTDPEDGRITKFTEKPEKPDSNLASMGIYIFSADVLIEALEADALDQRSSHDFGKDIIPKLLGEGKRLYSYEFHGFWKDVGTIASFHETSMDLLGNNPEFDLFDKHFPIMSNITTRPPHYIGPDGRLDDCLVSNGCKIYGTARHSILSTDVIIEERAVVEDSVLLPGAHVKSGAHICRAILGENSTVEEGVKLGSVDTTKDTAVVGNDVVIGKGE